MHKFLQILMIGLFMVTLTGVIGCDEPEVVDLTPTRVTDENATQGEDVPYEQQPGVEE